MTLFGNEECKKVWRLQEEDHEQPIRLIYMVHGGDFRAIFTSELSGDPTAQASKNSSSFGVFTTDSSCPHNASAY
jgi:hypothetical protein